MFMIAVKYYYVLILTGCSDQPQGPHNEPHLRAVWILSPAIHEDVPLHQIPYHGQYDLLPETPDHRSPGRDPVFAWNESGSRISEGESRTFKSKLLQRWCLAWLRIELQCCQIEMILFEKGWEDFVFDESILGVWEDSGIQGYFFLHSEALVDWFQLSIS